MSYKKAIISLKFQVLILVSTFTLLFPAQVCYALEPTLPSTIPSVLLSASTDSPMETVSANSAAGTVSSDSVSANTAAETVSSNAVSARTVSTDSVTSFAQLTEWIAAHQKSGGTVQLENDIYLEADEQYQYSGWLNDPDMYIDAGEHTIYIRGILTLDPYLNISGTSENGILHVVQGGCLELDIPVTAPSGYAVYQEDGSILNISTDKINGSIRYTEKPVAWPASDVADCYGTIENTPVVVLPFEEDIDTASFPTTSPAYLCEKGFYSYFMQELATVWNFDEVQEQFTARKRVLMTGNYTDDISTKAAPACLVTFLRKDSAVFLQCAALKNEEKQRLDVELHVRLDDPSMTCRLEWSVDGKNWQQDESSDVPYSDWDDSLKDENILINTRVFQDMPQLPRYFSIAVTDDKGHTSYSDTIELTGDNKIAGIDNGGGRGGETNPGNPEDNKLPPSIDQPDDSTPSVSAVSPVVQAAISGNAVLGNTVVEKTPAQESSKAISQENAKKKKTEYPVNKVDVPLKQTAGKANNKQTPTSLSKLTGQPPDSEVIDKLTPNETIPATDTLHSKEGTVFGIKVKHTAAAVIIILLIGTPVYLPPVRKYILKRVKTHRSSRKKA